MNLLVADDEFLIRNGIVSLDWGRIGITRVLMAFNGLEAKELIDQGKADILLSDIKMPGMSGLELAEYIYKNGKPVKVILLTGFGEFEYAKQAIRNHVSDYILKPIVPENLLESVSRAMQELKKEKCTADIVNEFREKQAADTLENRVLGSFKKMDTQITQIIKYMAAHFQEDLSLPVLAEIYHFSSVYLSRYIKKETGYSFVDLLMCIRLLHALKLLEENQLRVQLVCEQSGFRDQRYFSQIFKRMLGCKPIEYKKNKLLQKNYTLLELLEMKSGLKE